MAYHSRGGGRLALDTLAHPQISVTNFSYFQQISTIGVSYNNAITSENARSHKEDNCMDRRRDLIDRILNLTDEQFEQLLIFYLQQEKESVPVDQVPHQTSA